MKSGLLTLFILTTSAQIVFSQNVRVIRASERSTVTNSVIIPAPVHITKTSDTAEVARKTTAVPATNSSTKKNVSVKSVHGGTCKKPCVRKVCVDKSNSEASRKQAPVESTRK